MSRRAAHWLQTVTVPSASTAASRSASGAACGREKSSARPGSANQAASPVSQSDTATPLATAVEATVKAWLHRSGSSLPAVTLITRLRATQSTVARPACRRAQTGPRRADALGLRGMHGMLSVAIIILAYARCRRRGRLHGGQGDPGRPAWRMTTRPRPRARRAGAASRGCAGAGPAGTGRHAGRAARGAPGHRAAELPAGPLEGHRQGRLPDDRAVRLLPGSHVQSHRQAIPHLHQPHLAPRDRRGRRAHARHRRRAGPARAARGGGRLLAARSPTARSRCCSPTRPGSPRSTRASSAA